MIVVPNKLKKVTWLNRGQKNASIIPRPQPTAIATGNAVCNWAGSESRSADKIAGADWLKSIRGNCQGVVPARAIHVPTPASEPNSIACNSPMNVR